MDVHPARRRTAVAATVLTASSLVAGCGGSNDDLTKPSGGGATASGKATGGLTADNVVPTLTRAVRAKRTAHLTLSLVGGGQRIKAAGEVEYAGGRRELQTSLSGKGIPGTLTIRDIAGTIYLRVEDGSIPAGKFLQPDPAKKEDAGTVKEMRILSDVVDPLRALSTLDGQVDDVRARGQKTLDGVATTDYRVEVEAPPVLDELMKGLSDPTDASQLPKRAVFHLWVDQAGLLHRLTLVIPNFDFTYTLSRFGRPVRLGKPEILGR